MILAILIFLTGVCGGVALASYFAAKQADGERRYRDGTTTICNHLNLSDSNSWRLFLKHLKER